MAVILTMAMIIGSAQTVFAATARRSINTVSLRITSNIEAGNGPGGVDITTGSDSYYVEEAYITNEPSGDWKNGAKPKVRITLRTDGENYYFRTGFSKSNLTLTGDDATVSSVSRSGNDKLVINLTLGAIDSGNGGYDLEVCDLQWDEDQGHGYWGECGDAKRYEVKVYRGGTLINSSTISTTNSTYDLSSYITKSGTYTFRVRGVYNSTYKGDWEESQGWYVDSQTAREFNNAKNSSNTPSGNSGSSGPGTSGSGSGPSGSSGGPGATGNSSGAWLKDNVGWWYCNADRSYTVNNWQYINNKWYYFNERGYMVTGWVLWKNLYYYCGPNGDMLTNSWTPDGYFVDNNGVWVQGYR